MFSRMFLRTFLRVFLRIARMGILYPGFRSSQGKAKAFLTEEVV